MQENSLPKVAVVILNWNGAVYLRKFLPGLIKHTNRDIARIFVADNGSTDESLQVLQDNFTDVKLIRLDRNYGFAGGYNKALELIEAEYYVILNSDIELTENWLEPMLDYLESHRDVTACQPKILSFNDRHSFEHAGAAGGYIDFLGFPFCRGRVLDSIETDMAQYDQVVDIFWASGACLMIRARDFHSNGGFDADFFAHMEEIDLCWRLKSRSHRIVCVPRSTVYHVGGGTLNMEHPRKTYLNFRNNQLLLYKNLSKRKLIPVLIIRFFLDYIAAFRLLLTGKPGNAAAVFKARRDFQKMLPDFKLKRKENLQKVILINIPEISRRSIIFNYYVLGKRKFSDFF